MKGAKGPAGAAGGVVLYFSCLVDAAAAYYAYQFTNVNAPVNTLKTANQRVMLSARTLNKLRVHSETNVGKNVVFTVYKNGVATALTCTIASGVAVASDLAHSVSFAQGERVAVGIAHSAGLPGGGYFNITLEST